LNLNAFKAVVIGTKRSIRGWRIWLGIYVFNLIFAVILALPFVGIFSRNISRSLAGRDLLNSFSYKWFESFLSTNGGFFNSVFPQLVFVFVIYVFVDVFFAGGLYSIFSGEAKTRFGELLAEGSAYFFPVLMVTIMECTLLVIAYFGTSHWLRITDRWLLAVVLFMIINLLSDFVRAAVVIDDDGFWTKAKRGFEFVVHHPVSTTGIYLCCLLIGGAIIGLYFLFYATNDSTTALGVVIEIVVAQIFILLRILSKLIFYAGEAALYKENQIEVIKVKLEMLE
jgi:hypothetical protein